MEARRHVINLRQGTPLVSVRHRTRALSRASILRTRIAVPAYGIAPDDRPTFPE